MTVRARRLGLLALMLVAGPSLLGTSISLALEERPFNPSLNLMVSQRLAARVGTAGHRSDVWVIRGDPVTSWNEAADEVALWRRSFPTASRSLPWPYRSGLADRGRS